VDDGTERIECIKFKKDLKDTELNNISQYQLFDTLSIKGKISVYKDRRNLHIITIKKECDINCETFFWLEIIKQREIYKKPFILTDTMKDEINSFYDKEKRKTNKKEEEYNEYLNNFDKIKRRKFDNILNIKDEQHLKLNLYKYIYKNKLFNFPFADIKQVKELKELAIEIIQQKKRKFNNGRTNI